MTKSSAGQSGVFIWTLLLCSNRMLGCRPISFDPFSNLNSNLSSLDLDTKIHATKIKLIEVYLIVDFITQH